jgi:hypothetical protein
MEEVVTRTGRWTVSARSSGEVLAVRAGGPGLELGFLGAPVGFSPPEIQGWLTELIGVAGTTGNDSPAPRDAASSTQLPRILHQALTGLLFYEAELWGGPGERIPSTVACLGAGERVAFGWTGSGRIEFSQGGRPFQPAWLLVRDQEGREARAFLADARLPLEVRVIWPAQPDDAESAWGELEAHWPGAPERAPDASGDLESASRAGGEAGEGVDPSDGLALPEPEAPERGPRRPRGLWQFRSWMDRLAGPRPTEGAQPELIAHNVPGVPDLIPEPQPIVAGAAVAEAVPPAPIMAEAAVAEAVPPAPIAGEMLTADCVETVDPFDLGPLLEFGQSPVSVEPATAEPAAGSEPTRVDGPAAVEPVIAREPQAELRGEDVAASATETGPFQPRPRAALRRAAWPENEEFARADGRPLWRRKWFVAAVVVVLFAAGWILGRVDFSTGGRGIGSALKAIGLGPARYEATVTSRPAGAWIAVDGVDQARRTPATLELRPGAHEVVLSFSGVGGSSHTVNGKRGQRVALDVDLWGSLKITVPVGGAPISVAVDGLQRGYAPLDVDRLQPGIHRLQFSGPGLAPWEQTVEVHVNRTAELVAQPIASPATGLLEVRATLADETGSEPLKGAQVWIDGQPRGVTPLRLELPRGPHSVLVRYRNEAGPVQVIELPGGNLRYATIELGLDLDAPRLAATLAERIPLDRPTVLSASLDRARVGDVREMWLHVRTPEGAWRRYPMTVMKAAGGPVGVTVFPTVLFDSRGRAAWYVSASTAMGDEYFTEIRPVQAAARP